MASDSAQFAALDSNGDGLRVVFEKRGDRWQHRIDRVNGVVAVTALQSSEGISSDDWPASPPFQELSQETLPDGRTVLFLVGRAGTSHWSASIESALEPPQLIFDVACRHTQPPRHLGSAYTRLADDVTLEALLGRCAECTIMPDTIATRLPGTTRWKYRIL